MEDRYSHPRPVGDVTIEKDPALWVAERTSLLGQLRMKADANGPEWARVSYKSEHMAFIALAHLLKWDGQLARVTAADSVKGGGWTKAIAQVRNHRQQVPELEQVAFMRFYLSTLKIDSYLRFEGEAT